MFVSFERTVLGCGAKILKMNEENHCGMAALADKINTCASWEVYLVHHYTKRGNQGYTSKQSTFQNSV